MVRTNLELAKQFGSKVKEYRNIANYSLEKLAELCNCSTQTIWGIESGYNAPSFNTMDAISKALNVPIIYFFNFDTDVQTNINEKEFVFNKLFNKMNDNDKDFILRIMYALKK